MPPILRNVLFLLLFLPASVLADVARPAVNVDDLRAFADAWGYIKDNFVDEVDDRALLEAAIRGMLAELDEHSAWLSPDSLAGVEEQASGRYGGIGIRVMLGDGVLEILEAMQNSPAERAGLRRGDRIVAIDQRPLDAGNVSSASEWLRGEPGTEVELLVSRDDKPEPVTVALERAIIARSSVDLDWPKPRLPRLIIHQFQQNTPGEVDQRFEEIREVLGRNGDQAQGLILDLRNNPGGMMYAAIAVADRFLSGQLVVFTQGRESSSPRDYHSNPGEQMPGVPMVVLINGRSASASEILAGALQDHERALVIGEPSFGKGSIQTIWPLRNGGGIRLTTAHYYTPAGRRIQAGGITPDLPVSDGRNEDDDRMVDEAVRLFDHADRLHRPRQLAEDG
ncbi:MAG: S41 family peptidase [Wenzhouxiangella sp.]